MPRRYAPKPVTGPTVAAVVTGQNEVTIKVVEPGDVVAPRSRVKASDDTAARIAAAASLVAARIVQTIRSGVTIRSYEAV